MIKLKRYIEETLELQMGMLIPEGIELFPLDNDDPEEAYMFGTKEATRGVFLAQGDIDSFLNDESVGLFYIGLFGHGCNSNSFYICQIDSSSHTFLRLHTGGVYTDPKNQEKLIRQYLLAFMDFQKKIVGHVSSQTIMESMYLGDYKFTLNNGVVIELKESLFKHPNFDKLLKEITGERGRS